MVVLVVSPGAAAMSGLARRFEGHAEPLDGEAAAVVWRGVPTVELAVRMAVALHADAPVGEGVRVGVLVVSGEDPHARVDAQSRAFRVARAIAELAPAGVTLISAPPETLPPFLRCAAYGRLHPDPTGAPVSISRVVEVTRAATPPRALVVGRDAELADFRRVVAKALGSGSGAVVHIRGEAGIGKTHLLRELRRIASEHGFAIHRTSHEEHAVERPRSAGAVLVRSLLEASGSGPETIASSVARAAAEGRIDEEHVPFVHDLLDVPMEVDERRLFEAMEPVVRQAGHAAMIEALVRTAARRGPLLVEVEDTHWASEESRRLLGAVASRTASSTLLLVMTSRPSGDPSDEAWLERAGGPPPLRWALDRLRAADAQAMAAAILSRRRAPWMLSTSRYVDADAVLQCVERSGGHPLLLEQLLLGREEGIETSAPAPIAALVAARLATLSPGDRRAVELAAACGTRFDVAVVSAALQREPWDVGAAVTAGLVTVEGRGHRFAHAMVRDAVYAGLADGERRRIHRALARIQAEPVPRAEHLERAGDPRAASARLEAARQEDAAGRPRLALSHIERGLATAQSDAVRGSLVELAGRIHTDGGRPEDALAAFEQAARLAGSPIDRCRALLGSVSALRLQSRIEDAEAPLSEAEALATEHAQDELIGLAAYYRGGLLFARGDVAGCTSQHERAVRHARIAGQPRTEALALSGLGDAYYAQSRIGKALEVIGRCVRLARSHGFGRIEVGNLYMVGALRALENDLAGGLRDCTEAARMATRVGNRRAEMLATLNVGICLTVQGETAAALEWIARAQRIAEQMETGVFIGTIGAFEARARILGGEREAGLERARKALERARDGGMRFFGGVALGAVARATRSAQERERALDEGEELLSRPCMPHNQFYFHEDAIEAWCSAGRWDRVERCATALDAVDAREPIGRCRLLATRARALAWRGRDPSDEAAAEAVRVALAEVTALGFRPLQPALERALGRSTPPSRGRT